MAKYECEHCGMGVEDMKCAKCSKSLVHDHITTDDGSMGELGTVMPTVERVCGETENTKLFVCGPEPMMKAVHQFVTSTHIPCELSVESYMGCATGLCQGCVIERASHGLKDHSYHEKYSLVCIDGPIYLAQEIVFS